MFSIRMSVFTKMIPVKMSVSILLKIILEQYFKYEHCVMIINDESSTLSYTGNHQIITVSTQQNFENSVIEETIFGFQYGCKGFVIDTVEPAKIFELIEEIIKQSLVRYNTRKYLIIIEDKAGNNTETFRKISMLRFFCNVLIVVQKNPEIFQIFWLTFSKNENENRFEMVDTWFANNNTFLVRNDLYTDEVKNRNGVDLRIACFTYIPYTYCENHKKSEKYYGTELNLVIEYTRMYNLTPKFVNDVENGVWGTLHENGTGTGLMGLVQEDKADIAFAASFVWEFVNHHLDLSMPYIRTGITCLVPKPKILNGWITPLLSYKPTLWIIVIGNFIMNALFLFFLVMCLNKKFKIKTDSDKRPSYVLLDSFWDIMMISLGLTTQNKNSFIVIERIILAILFLSNLILNSTYFSGLASIMTVPRYEEPIDTLVDLANSDVEILGLFADWTLSIKTIKEDPYRKIVEHYRAASEDELRMLSKQDNYAFFMERLPYKNYGINDFIKGDVIENYHLMKEDVYWEYTEFFLRKSSVLAPSFDIFILKVLESGLASYWQREAVYRFKDPTVQKIASLLDESKINQEGAIKLQFSHVEGSFAMLFIGFFLSAITLITEKIIYYQRKALEA